MQPEELKDSVSLGKPKNWSNKYANKRNKTFKNKLEMVLLQKEDKSLILSYLETE